MDLNKKSLAIQQFVNAYFEARPTTMSTEDVITGMRWWNRFEPTNMFTIPEVIVCPECQTKVLDLTIAPFFKEEDYYYGCCICKQHICSSVSVACCLDCNKTVEQRKIFKTCKFSCQRELHNYSGVPFDGRYGSICKECHKTYLLEQEKAHHRYLVKSSLIPASNNQDYRNLVYIGEDKLRYFLRCKNLRAKLDERIDYDGADDILNECGPACKIRPWKVLKILARLIIIFRRYREEYYDPENGKYVVDGTARFEKRLKR